VDLAEQLDRSLVEQNKYQTLLRELLEAQRNRKSEQLSKEQLALFEAAWQTRSTEDESAAGQDDDERYCDAMTAEHHAAAGTSAKRCMDIPPVPLTLG